MLAVIPMAAGAVAPAATTMTIIPTISKPVFYSSSPHQNHRGFFTFKPSPKFPNCPSNFASSISIKASTLLNQSLSHKTPNPNTQIFQSCEAGNLREAMNLLCESSTVDSQLDSRTYSCVLQLCADLKSLKDGEKAHSLIRSSNVEIDGVLGAKLVFMYVKCGDLREGRRVFYGFKGCNVFIWNLLVSEYAKIGEFRESIGLFKEMIELEVGVDSHTLSCVLKCFASLGSVKEGEVVHGSLLKLGFENYNAVGNSLIAFYSKSKRIDVAQKVFDEMSVRDVISWNSIISGCVLNGFVEKGFQFFTEMWFSGIDMDLATMVSVLPACAEMGVHLQGRMVHGYAIKAGLGDEITLNNCLVDMYAKCNDLDSGVRVFGKMKKRSVVSWTSMLSGYARAGQFDKAIGLFLETEVEGVKPDLFALTSILHACSCNGSLERGKDIHDYVVRNGLETNMPVANALMDMYAKCGSMGDARSVFDRMIVRDIISWNTMIGGYSKNSLPNEALGLFSEMQVELDPNCVTMACILPACASLSALDRGREIHGHIHRNEFLADGHVANALVDMYAKCGALVLARLLFDRMGVRDLISWTVMIAGYGMHGHGRDAIVVFSEMRDTGIEPDEVSFVAILYACCHSGLVNEGWRFFNIMRYDCKIEPILEHYACMVDLLGRAGQLKKAYKFIEEMPIKPDSTVWGALLGGCRTYRDVKLAEKVAEHVFELEPENTGYYILLANIYAEAEKWEAVTKLRERIGRHRLRKNPGCSWTEIKSKVHVFVAGDKSHPQFKRIRSLLESVRTRMKEEGYTPKKRYALLNVDDMGKEEALCGHSEKLAISYGILNSPHGKPIRVAKNLRVCGDCHEVAKFVSKMFGREIILRDTNRFHHFEDGRCSCRGYW